jgi:hypothetical protein
LDIGTLGLWDFDREDARAAKPGLSFANGVCQIASAKSRLPNHVCDVTICRVTFLEVTVLADLIPSLIEENAAQRHDISTRVDV